MEKGKVINCIAVDGFDCLGHLSKGQTGLLGNTVRDLMAHALGQLRETASERRALSHFSTLANW